MTDKTIEQYQVNFFRMMLIDETGRKVIEAVLEKELGFDPQQIGQIIPFMEDAISHVDKQTKALYEKQQTRFVDAYNSEHPEQENVTSYRQINLDKATLVAAEAQVKTEISDMVVDSMARLKEVIGKQAATKLHQWVLNEIVLTNITPDYDKEEYRKIVAEPPNFINSDQTYTAEGGSATFTVIKKEN